MVKKHIHSYERAGKRIYKCTDPDCTHQTLYEFLVGKRIACAICGNLFIANYETLRRRTVRCFYCIGSKAKERDQEFKDLIAQSLMGEKA